MKIKKDVGKEGGQTSFFSYDLVYVQYSTGMREKISHPCRYIS